MNFMAQWFYRSAFGILLFLIADALGILPCLYDSAMYVGVVLGSFFIALFEGIHQCKKS